MRLSTTLLLPALVSLVHATSESAKVYILGDSISTSSQYPSLSPEEARLVIAHRLGVSSYHSLDHINEATLEHINAFGGMQHNLLSDAIEEDPSTLVVIMDGVSNEMARTYEKELELSNPAFIISDPPSFEANNQLVKDIRSQCDAVNQGKSRDIVSWDFAKDSHDLVSSILFQNHGVNYQTIVLMIFPESSYQAKHSPNPYGTYELPSASQIYARREQAEEPITITSDTSSSITPNAAFSPSETQIATKLPKVVPMCYSSADACISSTNNCSGHGTCFQKYSGADGGSAAANPCFACGCKSTLQVINGTNVTTHWGGGACSKVDISSPFWLISGFTVLLVFLVSWAIGMLFSIGEEKLPGVIGAGVSSAKTR